ncbi:MAG: hypothetical protein KAH72_00890 [Flavobacteriaceae bacterium]|nr:hypothetical protein [Flavobacteriaceae bacterium]
MYKDAVQNADLGIAYTFKQEIPYNQKTNIKLNESINSDIILHKSHWGVFDLVKVISQVKNESFQKLALMGGYNKQRPALYLQDMNRPLVVVGNTVISGNVALPKNGVKRGNISGHSYNGTQLIYGNTTQSNTQLPNLKNLIYLKNINENLYYNDSLEFIDIYEDQKLTNSFNKRTKIFKQNGAIYLNYVQLTGNLIIQSDTLIRINKTAVLHDIILIAPKIEIDDFTQGNFQVIASQNITIGANSKLSYPTALILINDITMTINDKKLTNQILIHSDAEVKGMVCFLSNSSKNNYQAQINIKENACVIGEVYCSQNIELKGMVKGSVYTKGFIANQNGSIYQNHIYNGEIRLEDLPKQYSGFLFEGLPKQIVQWVY